MIENQIGLDREEDQEKEVLEQDTDDVIEVKLSWNKKIIIIILGIISYFLFLLIFFPYTSFIRFIILKNVKEFKVDFVDLDIGFSSKIPIQLTDFYISNERDILINGDLIQIKANVWKFINKEIQGDLNLNSGIIKFKEFEFKIKNLNLKTNFKNSYDLPLSNWTGDIELNLKELFLVELWGPLKTLSLTDDEKNIKNAQIVIKIDKGRININKFLFNHNLFDVQITGSGRLVDAINNSTIDAKICLQPNAKLEELNPVIYTLYITSGGSIGGQLCIKIDGTFSNLNFKPENK